MLLIKDLDYYSGSDKFFEEIYNVILENIKIYKSQVNTFSHRKKGKWYEKESDNDIEDVNKYIHHKSEYDENINFIIHLHKYNDSESDNYIDIVYFLYEKKDFRCKYCHTFIKNGDHDKCYILSIKKKYYDVEFI